VIQVHRDSHSIPSINFAGHSCFSNFQWSVCNIYSKPQSVYNDIESLNLLIKQEILILTSLSTYKSDCPFHLPNTLRKHCTKQHFIYYITNNFSASEKQTDSMQPLPVLADDFETWMETWTWKWTPVSSSFASDSMEIIFNSQLGEKAGSGLDTGHKIPYWSDRRPEYCKLGVSDYSRMYCFETQSTRRISWVGFIAAKVDRFLFYL
jgi:hypothetical protein